MYANLPLSPRKLGTSLRIRGKRTTKEERNYSFYYLNTLLTISYAGFFAKSQIMFFSSIIIPILPAAQEWRHERIAFRCGIKYPVLCTQACPYRLAWLSTSLRVRGKLTLRKKAIKFYKSINWSNEYTKNRIGNASCPRLSGKVSAELTKGASMSRIVKINNKYEKTNKNDFHLCTQACPYRLARLGTSLRIRGKLTLRKKKYSFYYLNTLFVINLCRILRYS